MPMQRAWFIVALLAAVTGCAPTPGGVAPSAQRVDTSNFEPRLLAAHNSERASVGVPPLAWSPKLSQDAKTWAERIASEGELRHAPPEVAGDQGENLWRGSRGAFTLETMIGAFTDEKRFYRHGTFPDVSTTGKWQDVGHYTQVVWRGTQQVGCALAEGRTMDFLICRYWPAGNWRGQQAY
jgi:hypothetical protein